MASGHVNRTKRPNTVHSDASIACEQSPGRQRRRREPGKPTLRCLNRLSLSSASLAPLNRGSLNSAHIHGTDVPVEEPSTASTADITHRGHHFRKAPGGDIMQVGLPLLALRRVKRSATIARDGRYE